MGQNKKTAILGYTILFIVIIIGIFISNIFSNKIIEKKLGNYKNSTYEYYGLQYPTITDIKGYQVSGDSNNDIPIIDNKTCYHIYLEGKNNDIFCYDPPKGEYNKNKIGEPYSNGVVGYSRDGKTKYVSLKTVREAVDNPNSFILTDDIGKAFILERYEGSKNKSVYAMFIFFGYCVFVAFLRIIQIHLKRKGC